MYNDIRMIRWMCNITLMKDRCTVERCSDDSKGASELG